MRCPGWARLLTDMWPLALVLPCLVPSQLHLWPMAVTVPKPDPSEPPMWKSMCVVIKVMHRMAGFILIAVAAVALLGWQ